MTIDDSLQTTTSIDQAELERRVAHIYATEYADGVPTRGTGAALP